MKEDKLKNYLILLLIILPFGMVVLVLWKIIEYYLKDKNESDSPK